MTTWEYFLKSANDFEGSKALFWAGKMSMCIDGMVKYNIRCFGDSLELLIKCKEKYDEEIFKEIENK